MAEIKKISTELQLLDKFLDTSGSAGSSGSVLTSTTTGTSWVSAGTPGSGIYLPLSAGGSFPLTGALNINLGSTNVATIKLRRDTTGDNQIVGDIEFDTTAAQGGDDRIALIRATTSGGDGTGRGGAMLLYTRQSGSANFNTTTYNKFGAWFFPSNVTTGGQITVPSGYSVNIGTSRIHSTATSYLLGGNVGIGTTLPSTKLEVAGHVTINSPAGASQTSYGLRLRKTNSSSAVQAGGEILASPYGNNTNAANLIFKTADTAANLTQRMLIDGVGALQLNAYSSTNQTGTPTYILGTDASGNVVKTLTTPSPITSQAASLYDLIPNGAFTTTYAFTSTAGTYAKVMQGDDVITANGTYTVQMFVNDFAVGGTQFSQTYSGIMSWGSATNTNDDGGGAISEIVLHRSGHAANQGMTYLRTRETSSGAGGELRLEIMCNRTYTGASNVIFKFVRLI